MSLCWITLHVTCSFTLRNTLVTGQAAKWLHYYRTATNQQIR